MAQVFYLLGMAGVILGLYLIATAGTREQSKLRPSLTEPSSPGLEKELSMTAVKAAMKFVAMRRRLQAQKEQVRSAGEAGRHHPHAHAYTLTLRPTPAVAPSL